MRLRSPLYVASTTELIRRAGRPSLAALLTAWLAAGVSPPAQASIAREGTAVSNETLAGSDVRRGRMSWFGQYGYGRYNDGLHRHVWRDSGDNGLNASGLPQMVPGIALMDRRTLGHWFEVELNGRVFLVRQVDIGPHPRTGRLIDINAPLSDMAGWSPRNFPTDTIAKWRYVGSPATLLAQRQKPKLKQLALLDTWDMGLSEQPKLAFDVVSPPLAVRPPDMTRTAALGAPWLATAPKTADLLLASPRHWASTDKRARMNLGAPLVPLPPVARTAEAAAPKPQPRRIASASRTRIDRAAASGDPLKPLRQWLGLRW